MTRFPTPAHLTSWARFAPGIAESAGRKKGNSGTGKGNRYLRAVLGDAAAGAGKTNTFLGERLLSVAHPADVVVTANADGFCGFGRHGDADRREVTPVRGDL